MSVADTRRHVRQRKGSSMSPDDPGTPSGGAKNGIFAVPAIRALMEEILPPGRYPMNPYAYDLEIAPVVTVPTGFVGVETNLVGDPPKEKNQYLSEVKERGIQKTTRKPGTYYLNPHAVRIDNVDVQT